MSIYGIGDELIIVKEIHGHEFEIGEMVTIIDVTELDYLAENGYGEQWWVRDEELDVEK